MQYVLYLLFGQLWHITSIITGMPPGPPSMMVAQPMRPPGFPAPPPMVRPPAPVPQAAPQEDEPPSKKQKTEEQLVPEEEWLKLHKVRTLRLNLIMSWVFYYWKLSSSHRIGVRGFYDHHVLFLFGNDLNSSYILLLI